MGQERRPSPSRPSHSGCPVVLLLEFGRCEKMVEFEIAHLHACGHAGLEGRVSGLFGGIVDRCAERGGGIFLGECDRDQ